ncbi:MAG: hypothetical protein H7Z75_19095 [Ferruginibacter sp.]|nr:hypothetical protein [Cytophagales bacterium]
MKNALITGLVGGALAALSFISPPNPLIGRWQQKFSDGMTALCVFRPDGSLDFFVNGKAFANGKYYVRQDTFALAYPSCGPAYYGRYQLRFFARDSVRFTVLADTCRERRAGMDGVTLGRVNPDRVKSTRR